MYETYGGSNSSGCVQSSEGRPVIGDLSADEEGTSSEGSQTRELRRSTHDLSESNIDTNKSNNGK